MQKTIKKPPDDLDDESNNRHRDAEDLEEFFRNVRLILRSIESAEHSLRTLLGLQHPYDCCYLII
jgi:hypothetical protein